MRKAIMLCLVSLSVGQSVAYSAEISAGKSVFQQHCSYCHAPGLNRPGTLQLFLTRGEERSILEERTDLNADYIEYVVRHGLNAMPAFTPTTLTFEDLDALSRYLTRNRD